MNPLQGMGAVRMSWETADKKTSQQSTTSSHYFSPSISFMEALLWIMGSSEITLMMDYFLTNKQTKAFHFTRGYLMSHVMDYCDFILWCFNSCLDFNSNSTHLLQRINWCASDAKLNFTKSVQLKKQTHRHLQNSLTSNALKFRRFKCDLCVVRPYSGFSFKPNGLTRSLPLMTLKVTELLNTNYA